MGLDPVEDMMAFVLLRENSVLDSISMLLRGSVEENPEHEWRLSKVLYLRVSD